MTPINSLMGHKDVIHRLYVISDIYLLSTGKGSVTSSALFAWDLRKFGFPLYEEGEKN